MDTGSEYGAKDYVLTVKYLNKMDNYMAVWLLSKMTYVNDEQMDVYHVIEGGVMPGEKGDSELTIYYDDLKKHKNPKQIETAMGIMDPESEEAYYSIPMVINLNAAE